MAAVNETNSLSRPKHISNKKALDPRLESGPSEALVFGAFGTWPIGQVP